MYIECSSVFLEEINVLKKIMFLFFAQLHIPVLDCVWLQTDTVTMEYSIQAIWFGTKSVSSVMYKVIVKQWQLLTIQQGGRNECQVVN